jgi:hypothetical protein
LARIIATEKTSHTTSETITEKTVDMSRPQAQLPDDVLREMLAVDPDLPERMQ